ncbi:DUF3109 family protein [Prevotella sp. MGM1]|uniref:DUF3109 family protein n=1 Tax=Prevotella sp. MGM1 TaxID=2033405 RepID=UPI000CEA045C|nr:DUF3109 family protein [Prevotella sp. MGM1]GAY26803.1 DUF3109 domain-containing protein [Prevotella sp. MGM1]
MEDRLPSIIEVGDVLVSIDIFREKFCCDLDACHGECCVEGDAGAPVTIDEVAAIEDAVETVWPGLTASAQAVIDRQGVAYTDEEGDLVTSIVGGKDCVFTCHEGGCCFCALEKAYREGSIKFCKPISCALYPIREVALSNGTVGLNYHQWDVCRAAMAKGRETGMPVYRFLKEPLIRRFGAGWYSMLEEAADELKRMGMI